MEVYGVYAVLYIGDPDVVMSGVPDMWHTVSSVCGCVRQAAGHSCAQCNDFPQYLTAVPKHIGWSYAEKPAENLTSFWLATIWSERLAFNLEDTSSNPLCGHEPGNLIT
jgi:hypothetical protein